MTSPVIHGLSDDELSTFRSSGWSQAKPLDKYRMVRLLQDLQQVVQVTGDWHHHLAAEVC